MLVVGVNTEQAPALSRGGTANIPTQTRHGCAGGWDAGRVPLQGCGSAFSHRKAETHVPGDKKGGCRVGKGCRSGRHDHGAREPGVGYEVRLGKPARTLRRVKGRADTLRPCPTESWRIHHELFLLQKCYPGTAPGTVDPAKDAKTEQPAECPCAAALPTTCAPFTERTSK